MLTFHSKVALAKMWLKAWGKDLNDPCSKRYMYAYVEATYY